MIIIHKPSKLFRASNDAQFMRLWHTRTDFHPLQVCPVHIVDPQTLLVRGVFTPYSFALCVSLKKCEFLPSATKHLRPCSRKQTCINIKITAFFFFWLLEAVCITLRIQILHSQHDFATLKCCESSAPLNMQWYPLSSWTGAENTP